MAGPFTTYVPPGVYVDTIADTTVATLAPGLRLGAFIGVAQEILSISNFEMIRGSSATNDIPFQGEDVSDQFDGTNREFFVSHFPVVTGQGQGITTNNPNDLTVTIDGNPAQVVGVEGATGRVVLGNIPPVDSVVKVNYFFSRKDTHVTDDDLSEQADGSNKVFKV